MSGRFPPGGLLDEGAQAAIINIEAREDERCKALVCEAVSRRALGGNAALFGNSVGAAWRECKAAYDDTEFRNAYNPMGEKCCMARITVLAAM